MSAKFGDKLRAARTRQGLTLKELAASIGSSKAYVWQLENKKNAKPSAQLLLKISDHFGESPEFFLDDLADEHTERQRDDAMYRKIQKLSEDDKKYINRIVSGLNRDRADEPKK